MNANEGSVWKRRSKGIMADPQQNPNLILINPNKKKKNSSKMNPKTPKDTTNGYPLLRFEQLPDYMKDNEFILDYYRADWPLKQALFSLFRWHNETLNVWTHLIGFVVFLGLTITNLMHVPQVTDFLNILTWSFPLSPGTNASHNSLMDTPKLVDLKHEPPRDMDMDMDIGPPLMAATRWPFFVFLAGSMFCLLSSTTCHLLGCHSHRLNLLLLQMDYVGITVMIITSFFPPIYYIFQCNPLWQLLYLGGITLMGGITVVTLLSPALSTAKHRSFRAFLFVGMGLFGVVPAAHAVVANWHEPQRNATLAYEAGMAASYLVGTVFYVSRVPERWRPGWFDLAGHSHQIFHCFVIMGALAHYGAALVFLEFRGRVGCS